MIISSTISRCHLTPALEVGESIIVAKGGKGGMGILFCDGKWVGGNVVSFGKTSRRV